MIPMKDKVNIIRAGELDDWGRPSNPTTRELKCRIDYAQDRYVDKNGNDKVSRAIIYFKGVTDIRTTDKIEWIDELGQLHSVYPSKISPLKDFSKVIMTKVVI